MKAILISGFEYPNKKKLKKGKYENMTPELIGDTKRFARYLVLKARLKIDDIFVFKPSRIKMMGIWGLFECIREIIDLYPNEPLVIYYSGHGEKKYWNLRANRSRGEPSCFLRFRKMARILSRRSAPLIVIADCCYGMAIGKHLKKLNYPWLLLGLAPENRVGYGSIERQIELFWSKRMLARPRYDNNKKLVSFIKLNVRLYDFKLGKGRRLKKFYFSSYAYKKVRAILRLGSDLDYLLFSKK